jgi:hypothetical protein
MGERKDWKSQMNALFDSMRECPSIFFEFFPSLCHWVWASDCFQGMKCEDERRKNALYRVFSLEIQDK